MLPIGDDGSPGEATVFPHGPGAHHGAVGAWGDGPQFRQESAHPHGVAVFDGTLYVADLGTNGVVCWSIDYEAGTLRPSQDVTVHDLAGPRHVQITQNGRWAFALNELDNTLSTFRRNGDGTLATAQTLSTLPEGWAEQHADPTTFPNESALNHHTPHSSLFHPMIALYTRAIAATIQSQFSLWTRRQNRLSQHKIEPSRGRIPWVCCFSHDSRFILVQEQSYARKRTGARQRGNLSTRRRQRSINTDIGVLGISSRLVAVDATRYALTGLFCSAPVASQRSNPLHARRIVAPSQGNTRAERSSSAVRSSISK